MDTETYVNGNGAIVADLTAEAPQQITEPAPDRAMELLAIIRQHEATIAETERVIAFATEKLTNARIYYANCRDELADLIGFKVPAEHAAPPPAIIITQVAKEHRKAKDTTPTNVRPNTVQLAVLKALSQHTRRHVYSIAHDLGKSNNAISGTLTHLQTKGLVKKSGTGLWSLVRK
jgi:predicted transcriptional regulator